MTESRKVGQVWCAESRNLPKSRDQSQVKIENILEPLDGAGGLVGENLDQVGPGLVTSRLEGVVVELLDAVANGVVDLGARQGTVDS